MNAIQFIKDYGVDKAREVVATCHGIPYYTFKEKTERGYSSCKSVDLVDLKRLVDNLVYGHGLNDSDKAYKKSKEYKVFYATWVRMLERCFSELRKNRGDAYKEVSCCSEWLVFSKFASDLLEIENFEKLFSSWHLDKDILVRGNKTYSKETVSIVPKDINNLLVAKHFKNTGLPQGVTFKGGAYVAQITMFGKNKHIGRFRSPETAFLAYKNAKEEHIKVVANKWKDSISSAVYESLMSWGIKQVIADYESIYSNDMGDDTHIENHVSPNCKVGVK